MINKEFQILKQERNAKIAIVLTNIIDREWNRVSRQLDALDTDSSDVTKAAILVGPVSYTHLPSPRDKRQARMPSSA